MRERRAVKQAESDARIWDRFDVFFGLFVIANGVVIGIEIGNKNHEDTLVWSLVEFGFFIVFCTELFMRAVLSNQLVNYSDDSLSLGIFPRMSWSEVGMWLPDTLRYFPVFVRQAWVRSMECSFSAEGSCEKS